MNDLRSFIYSLEQNCFLFSTKSTLYYNKIAITYNVLTYPSLGTTSAVTDFPSTFD